MSRDQDNRIAHYLSVYVTDEAGAPIPPDPEYIRDAVRLILHEKVLTREEMRREALSDYSVVIPDAYFPNERGEQKK